jgi:hypothetical protein
MPGGTRTQLGNELFAQALYLPAVTFPTLATNASGTNTVTVKGVLSGDLISWNMQAPPAHLVLDNAYVSANDTITLLWSSDVTGITGATVAIIFEVTRPENASMGLAALPSSIQ